MRGRGLLVALALATRLSAQTLPQGVLEAERDKRWADAEALYRAAVRAEPDRSDLWKRLADVLSADGRIEEAAAAFEEAARLSPGPELYAQASSARAMVGEPRESLRWIERAIALAPDDAKYLRRRADLRAWVGDYRGAEKDLRQILASSPQDLDTRLQLARIQAWSGDYPEALSVLEEYRALGGEPSVYDAERALALAWADRPEEALAGVDAALANKPDHPPLLVGRAVALTRAHRYEDARRDLEKLEGLAPEDAEVRELRRVLATPLQSGVDFDATGSRDGDGIERAAGAITLDYKVGEGDYLNVGARSTYSTAPEGSPLAPLSGGPESVSSSVWGALDLTLSPKWSLRAGGGGAGSGFGETIPTYEAKIAGRLDDTLRFEVGTGREFFDVSPRARSLGIVGTRAYGSLFLSPGFEWRIGLTGELGGLSDDNDRWSLGASIQYPIVRGKTLNLDLGWSGYFMSYRQDFDHGYYDPSAYQRHLLTASFYFKFSDDDGIGLFMAPGIQADAKMEGVELAGEVGAEIVLGIYRKWLFKGRFAASHGASDYTESYWLASGGFFVMRRF